MDLNLKYFDVSPKVIPADRVSTVRIRPRYAHVEFPDITKIKVAVYPVDGLCPDGSYRQTEENNPLRGFTLEDGTLVIEAYFTGEQEHGIYVTLEERPGERNSFAWALNGNTPRLRFNVYSLFDDLMKLRPYKGDFHVHTNYSDGREDPRYVAARFRQEGFDFAAITDHRKYAPSLLACECWKDVPNGFKVYPGEEVHVPDTQVHVINFGSSFSVNDKAWGNEDQYRKECAARMESMQDIAPENRAALAGAEWAFDQIRAGGGIAMFCHPYWLTNKYEINEALTTDILRRKNFDVFELIGGFFRYQWRSNNCQTARYMQERACGNNFPVAGVSDSHGSDRGELFGWYYTIVLASSDAFPDLADGIRGGTCVAVEEIAGEVPRVYGDFRLVKYISFLIQDYFPVQAEICRPEGALMLEHLAGSQTAYDALKVLGNRTEILRNSSFSDDKQG